MFANFLACDTCLFTPWLNVGVNKQLIAVALTILFVLTACSSQSDSSPSTTPMVTKSASPAPSESISDPCAVLDQMQASLSTAFEELFANPDPVTAFEAEFDNQITLVDSLMDSLQGDSAEQQQLQADLDAAVFGKDEALRKFSDAQESDSGLSQTLGMADAALSASDALISAQRVVEGLGTQLMCDQP